MQQKAESLAWLESLTGERIPIAESCVLGRAKGCQIVVDDSRVSRRHAMIHRQGAGEFWLVDLGSANGTRLNGRHVSQPCRLSDLDKIAVADALFIFRQPGERARASEPHVSIVNATVAEIRRFDCWLLVADMADSTQLVHRLEAKESANVTGRWLADCKAIIESSHGVINKFLGDGFFAYWPERSGAKAEVAAALQELKKLQAKGQPSFRVVLHYGVAISGGAPSLGEESLSGKDVTFVFRMEDLASVLGSELLLSEPAVRKLEELCKPLPEGAYALAGFDGDHHFFSL
jgi:adenylate cyclase